MEENPASVNKQQKRVHLFFPASLSDRPEGSVPPPSTAQGKHCGQPSPLQTVKFVAVNLVQCMRWSCSLGFAQGSPGVGAAVLQPSLTCCTVCAPTGLAVLGVCMALEELGGLLVVL